MDPRAELTNLFITYEWARVFVPESPFQSSVMFANKAGPCPFSLTLKHYNWIERPA
jgi:hypothetical protein